MTKLLHRHCTFKTVRKGNREEVGFQPRCRDVKRRRRSDVLRQIVPDTSSGDREGSIVVGGDWRVKFGGQSVMNSRPSAVHQSRLARCIYFLPVHLSVHPFVLLLLNLWTWCFENKWTNFDASGSRDKGMKQSVSGSGGQRSKVKVTGGQTWKHHLWPHSVD